MKYKKNLSVEDVYYGCHFFQKEDLAVVVFQALGWFHTRKWTQEEDAIENTVKDLIQNCLKNLTEKRPSVNCSTGGLTVELWINDGKLYGDLLIEL